MFEQRTGFPGEQNEDGLGDVLGEVPVGAELPRRCVVHEREVPLHELGKRCLGSRLDELAE
jgi:hypothetical protein